MLKFTFLLLFLLNSSQISTASQDPDCYPDCENFKVWMIDSMIDEKIKVNATTENVELKIELYYVGDQFKEIRLHGAKLYEANEELNALDEIALQFGWINESHVELCPGFPALRDKNSSEISSYNSSFLIQYDNFDKVLSEILVFEVDVKKLRDISINNQRRFEIAHKVHEFSQRLRCLQKIKSMNNEEYIRNMTDLYEAFCYVDQIPQKVKTKRYYKRISFFGFFIIISVFIVLCVMAIRFIRDGFA